MQALADAVGVSCRLIRAVRFGGKDYTITVVVLLYEIEYYVDLMSDPCTFLQMSDENLSQEQAEAAEKAQLEFQVVQNNSDPSSHCLGNGSYDDTDERIREVKNQGVKTCRKRIMIIMMSIYIHMYMFNIYDSNNNYVLTGE